MKITIETDDCRCEVEWDILTLDDSVIDMFKACLIGAGYHHETVLELFEEEPHN